MELAAAAGARQVALTHHDPMHDDVFVGDIEDRAREHARRRGYSLEVCCAHEGLELVVEPGVEKDQSEPAAVPRHPSHGARRILVVDDDEDIRSLAALALTRDGHIVTSVAGGAEALAFLEENVPDLVVLDLQMPPPGGIEVLRQLRARSATAEVLVLVLTAMSDEASTRSGFEVGADDYVTKPFTMQQLAARVRACLARSRVPSSLSRSHEDS